MQGTRARRTTPAPSYAAHREQVLAAGFPYTAAVVLGLTFLYASLGLQRAPTVGQFTTYGLELLIPLVGLLLARTALRGHVEAVALATDLCFTAVLAGRLLLPATTASGTALFLSLKMVATALLWPWHPQRQYISTAATMLFYYVAIAVSGRTLTTTHQLVGPLIGAVLSCVGATIADRTRRDLWWRSAALAASELRLRSLLDSERTLVAIAREISVLTDLHSTLERINGLTAEALACDVSNSYLIDERRGEVAAAATSAAAELREQILAQRATLELPLVRELITGRSVVINDPRDQAWFPPGQLEGLGVRRIAFAPITAQGRALGVLTVTRTTTDVPFDEREVALLKAIAAQAAIAIENARLFDGLAKSEASYRDLFERATDLIVVIEETGALRFANQAALDFFGIAAEHPTALRWQALVPDDSRRRLERRLALARRRPSSGPEPGLEIEVLRADGTAATLEVGARLISAPGQPRMYQCIGRDVTERRRHERDLQQLLTQLREANRLQSEFVANMSHELRTPLNVIIGYADLLGDELTLPADGDGRLFLTRISAAGRALHRMVESVLEYARLDRGRYTLITTRFPASQLLHELRELADDFRGSSELTLDIQEHADVLLATDFDRLYSILSNLLLNAIKFTPSGSVEVTLRQLGDGAEFIVRDTGIGIDTEDLAHVFEPFRQVDGSATRSYGGVGLGLAIVRRNVELLHGSVEVQSRLGSGTTFRVRIPIDVETEADLVRASSAA